MNTQRTLRALVLGLGGPFALVACTNVAGVTQSICCTDPTKVTVTDPALQGSFNTFVTAAGNLNGAASGALADVTQSCRAIALDLGATSTDQAGIEGAGTTEEKAADGWCTLAATKIQASLVGSATTITYKAPACEASVNAKAACNAECSGKASCDIKTTPPVCKGGELIVECKGKCDVTPASVSIKCTGKCGGKCTGKCSASAQAPSVTCDGTCQGNCAAGTGTGNTGIQADGTCKGTCSGSCTGRPGSVSASCEGECSGSCEGACDVTSTGGSVRCSGKCTAESTPLSCEGGTLEGGCNVDVKCDATCKASVEATAKCTAPALDIQTDASKLVALSATLKANLPALLTILDARGQVFVDNVNATANLAANGGLLDSSKLGVAGSACVVVLGSGIVTSGAQAQAALAAAVKVKSSFSLTKLPNGDTRLAKK